MSAPPLGCLHPHLPPAPLQPHRGRLPYLVQSPAHAATSDPMTTATPDTTLPYTRRYIRRSMENHQEAAEPTESTQAPTDSTRAAPTSVLVQVQHGDAVLYADDELAPLQKQEKQGKCHVAGCSQPLYEGNLREFHQRFQICDEHIKVCLPLLTALAPQLEELKKYILLRAHARSQNRAMLMCKTKSTEPQPVLKAASSRGTAGCNACGCISASRTQRVPVVLNVRIFSICTGTTGLHAGTSGGARGPCGAILPAVQPLPRGHRV